MFNWTCLKLDAVPDSLSPDVFLHQFCIRHRRLFSCTSEKSLSYLFYCLIVISQVLLILPLKHALSLLLQSHRLLCLGYVMVSQLGHTWTPSSPNILSISRHQGEKQGAFLYLFPDKRCSKLLVYVTKLTHFKMKMFLMFNPGGNRPIHLSVRHADPNICIWIKANLNNPYTLCMISKQPKPPFPQGKGMAKFWSFQVASIRFPPFVKLFTGCQLEMIDLHCRAGIRCFWLPAKKERAVFQERCHKPRWCWREAVDFAPGLTAQGAQPSSHGSNRTHEGSRSSYISGPGKGEN